MLLELFTYGRITLEPQPEGRYVARSRWFPRLALTGANENAPVFWTGACRGPCYGTRLRGRI